jgi:hypothetical protein
MSVRNFLRRQTDASQTNNSTTSTLDPQRPLSEYDNIKPQSSPPPKITTNQTHFPLGDIKFRFDDLPLTTKNIMKDSSNSNTSAVHYNNKGDNQQTTHQYENVLDTLQMRSKRESDQQVKMNQNDEQNSPQRSVMSDAKSSFFGINNQQKSAADDEFDRLIEDIGNATIISGDQNQYVNLPNDSSQVPSNHDKVSATSSASGSSSTTATPSASPTRQERTGNSRKNSEGSNRSKSPKFMLPETTSPASPSQVCEKN